YINILLFALPLNILVHNQRNHKSPTPSYTRTTRLLCECELYATVNYDNDPEMKKVMQQFENRTSQRFEEYDDRMKTTRQKCKEQCDKEIEKIILKDKLEKELMDKFSILQTDIQSDSIPTCVCEKSLADKVEKGCLRCGSILGAAMPEFGLIGGTALYTLNQWLITATSDAITAAEKAATALATKAGVDAVKREIINFSSFFDARDRVFDLTPIVNKSTFNNYDALIETADKLFGKACIIDEAKQTTSVFCNSTICEGGGKTLKSWVKAGNDTFEKTLSSQKVLLEAEKVGAVEATYASYEIAIIASIVAIVVIILVMVIIYKILRYRRKKKMKKKLQYIKLLEE
ncbi:rifin, partial [Plasmodium reichenowi]